MSGRRAPRPRAAARAALAAAGALCAAWAAASLLWPPGFDHGLYAWTGDVVVRGGMMYRDAWDMHGPLVPYLFAGPEWALGRRFWGVRLLDLAFLALGTAALWRLVARAGPAPSRTAAWWAAALFALTYASLGYNDTAQPDGWVGLAAAAAFAPALLAGQPRAAHLALAGAAVGLFTLVKPFYLLLGLVPLVPALVGGGRVERPAGGPRARGAELRRAALAAAAVGAAAAVPIAAVAALYAARGALDSLFEVHLLYTNRVYNDGPALQLGRRLAGVTEFVARGKVVPVAFAAAAAGAAALWRRRERTLLAALGVWAGLMVFFAVLQNKFYYYHWVATLPPFAVLAAYGLAAAHRAGDGLGAPLAAATVAVIAGHAAPRPVKYVGQAAAFALGRRTADEYYATFNEGGASGPLARRHVAEYLRARVPAGEGIAVWGTDAGITYSAGHPTPFRLAGWYWPIVYGRGTPVQAEYAREYVRSLRARPPAYLVVNRRAGEIEPDLRLDRYPAVADAVRAGFVPDTALGPFDVWRRRDVSALAARPTR